MDAKTCYRCGQLTFCPSCGVVPPAPPPLVWSDAKPTVPGWYWWRRHVAATRKRITGLR